ncbi:MAG TPA: AAA family ATPase [Candidatus Deferrimicrobium sp.]|nr:AAA family ATPase [Candidatus Deferrimicrobium sp.]
MNENRLKLAKIEIKGYKSIDSEGQSIEFGDVTVLLGANGAGKSNLVSFFKLLNYMTSGNLQKFIGQEGYAESLLHYGAKTTPVISAKLKFEDETNTDTYDFTLAHASGDTLIFTQENVTWRQRQHQNQKPFEINLGAGHNESKLPERARSAQVEKESEYCKIVLNQLHSCRVYQFHDTSKLARIRNYGYIGDNEYLRDDAGNLAAFLYAMQNKKEWEKYYQRIVRHIRMIFPQFGEFILKPSPLNDNQIRLDWTEKDNDYRFGPHQLSDGGLRFMAMATLLLQPPELIPGAILIDEPELGLHPVAISALAGMMHSASEYSQVIVATQSPRLIDEFEANVITVVERDEKTKRSLFKKLDEEELKEWLADYTLSELWEKNVFGGRP